MVESIVRRAASTPDGFRIQGTPYRRVANSPIGAGVEWVLCGRIGA